jgi:hypothetical protein
MFKESILASVAQVAGGRQGNVFAPNSIAKVQYISMRLAQIQNDPYIQVRAGIAFSQC